MKLRNEIDRLHNEIARLSHKGEACIICLRVIPDKALILEDRDGWKVCSDGCLEKSNRASLEEERLGNTE